MLIVYSYARKRCAWKKCSRVIYGQRVQNSVFECSVSPSDYLVLVHDLLKIANIDEDSLRFYKLGSRYADRIERYGRERSLPVNDVMMI